MAARWKQWCGTPAAPVLGGPLFAALRQTVASGDVMWNLQRSKLTSGFHHGEKLQFFIDAGDSVCPGLLVGEAVEKRLLRMEFRVWMGELAAQFACHLMWLQDNAVSAEARLQCLKSHRQFCSDDPAMRNAQDVMEQTSQFVKRNSAMKSALKGKREREDDSSCCANCGGKGHDADGCPPKNPALKTKCHKCGGVGHFQKACPLKK